MSYNSSSSSDDDSASTNTTSSIESDTLQAQIVDDLFETLAAQEGTANNSQIVGRSESGNEFTTNGDNSEDVMMEDLLALLTRMTVEEERKRYAKLAKRVQSKNRRAAIGSAREATLSASDVDDEDLQQEGERFLINESDILGSGGFGVVYRAFDTRRGCYCAVKAALVGPDRAQSVKSEFDVFLRLTHPNIVRVLHFDISRDNVARLFMEWVPGGSIASLQTYGVASVGSRASPNSQLSHNTNSRRRLHEITLRRYAYDALCGLRYLHSQNVVHRDVKPANMLVSGQGSVKLADLGVASLVLDASTSATGKLAGTLIYMAPECVRCGQYSAASDMWSWACSVVEMATGRVPWSHLPNDVRRKVPILFYIGKSTPPNHHPPIPTHLSGALREILQSCFAYDPKDRPTADQIVSGCDYFSMTSDFRSYFADMEPIRGFSRVSIRTDTAAARTSLGGAEEDAITPDLLPHDAALEATDDVFDDDGGGSEHSGPPSYIVHDMGDSTEILGGPMSSHLLLLGDSC